MDTNSSFSSDDQLEEASAGDLRTNLENWQKPDESGYLLFRKKSALVRTWKWRWIIVQGGLLFYFETQDDSFPVGVLVLKNYAVKIHHTAERQHGFDLVNQTDPSDVFLFCAYDEPGLNRWLAALQHYTENHKHRVITRPAPRIITPYDSPKTPATERSHVKPILEIFSPRRASENPQRPPKPAPVDKITPRKSGSDRHTKLPGLEFPEVLPELPPRKKKHALSSEKLNELNQQFHARFPDGKMTEDEFIETLSRAGGNREYWSWIFQLADQKRSGRLNFQQFIFGVSMQFCSTIEERIEIVFALHAGGEGFLSIQEAESLIKTITTDNAPIKWPTECDGLGKEEFISVCKSNAEVLAFFEATSVSNISFEIKAVTAEAFGHQAGGHSGSKGLLKEAGCIFKHYSEKEFNAYEDFKRCPSIQPLIPKYFGRTQRNVPGTEQLANYIMLEDLTEGMGKPCIMDLKMGTTTYEENASTLKLMKLGPADTLSTSSTLGFRVVGIRAYQTTTDSFEVKDKAWGLHLQSSAMPAPLKTFIQNGERLRYEIFKAMLPELKLITQWFSTQTDYKFYGCSVLFVYDGASTTPKIQVKLVDFAHVVNTTDGTKDVSFLKGLLNLEKYFEDIIREEACNSPHEWKNYFLKKPSFCSVCTNFVWLHQVNAYRCALCHVEAHAGCYKLGSNDCTKPKPADLVFPPDNK